MKNVKKIVAITAAVLMMGTVVPATVAFAEENKQESTQEAVQKVALTQTAVSQDSMTISWADADYADSDYTVVIWSLKADAPSYGSTKTFVKNVSKMNTVTFDGLAKDMPYQVVVYKNNHSTGKTDVIAEGKLSTLPEVQDKIGLTAVSQDSMTITWQDEDVANGHYVVMIYSLKADAPSYGSTKTFVKYVDNTNVVTFDGLAKDMPYQVCVTKSNHKEGEPSGIGSVKLSTLA